MKGEPLTLIVPDCGVLDPGDAWLAHLGRLCAAGELAASFAHELHQPLCAIALYADTCLRLLNARDVDPSALRDALTDVHRQAMRASNVIKQLRRYVRSQPPAVKAVEIGDLVDRAVALTDYEARNLGVSIHVRIDASLPLVLAEPVQIEQVLHNLVRNALDAIASGGPAVREIVIEARQHEGARVEIDVHNTGDPISETTKQQLFRPFFSTKRDGLGMGLYVARLIVTAHHGTIECIPNPNGATFRCTLPAAGNKQARMCIRPAKTTAATPA